MRLLSQAINNIILKGIFLSQNKIAAVFSLNKGILHENYILNFRPVCVLTIVSKIY